LLQSRHRLGQRFGLVVLKNQPAVVERPDYEAKSILIANFDMTVALDPLGDGRECLLDGGLLFGGLTQLADIISGGGPVGSTRREVVLIQAGGDG